MSNSAGIYFGPRDISVVEVSGKKIINQIKVSRLTLSSNTVEDKVPEEIKMIALLKDEFRKNKLSAKKFDLVLSGNSLVIRTFDIPVLPRDEIYSAVTFEAKKYIPFKLEELVFDYYLSLDHVSKKSMVLLVGIKRDVLEQYFAMFKQLNLEIRSIEYSAFSAIRLLKMAGVKEKGISVVLNIDSIENDEVNFLVLQDGFPLFSRDIILKSDSEQTAPGSEPKESVVDVEKIKAELRVSIDFYNRKFPSKKIENSYFLANEELRSALESIAQEKDIISHFIDQKSILGKAAPFSLVVLKAYAGALFEGIKTSIKINLLTSKDKPKTSKKQSTVDRHVETLVQGISIEPKMIVLGICIIVASILFNIYIKSPIKNNISDLVAKRPQVSFAANTSTNDQLKTLNTDLKDKLGAIKKIIEKQVFITPQLSVIVKLLPSGIWIEEFKFRKDISSDRDTPAEMRLSCVAYLGDNDKEIGAANSYVSTLKANESFNKIFKLIRIESIENKRMQDTVVTKFTIICKAN
ncbi:MAG: pilus assembly protein PilM [Candidatus Omnitrophota bacterium]|jgi:Tfp pilus assembly PilM family ATPase